MNFTVDGRSWKPSRAEANRADDKKWGDVAAPDIVGLQYNSREETIKTRSITLTLSLMLLLFPEPPQQQNAPSSPLHLLQLQALQHFLVCGMKLVKVAFG
jgi:hypothetical protein